MSLARLLKWINELGGSGSSDGKQALKGIEEELYHLPFPDEKPSEISRRAWLELLLRSRKRLLLAYQVGAVGPSLRSTERAHHREPEGSCESSRHKRHRRHRHRSGCAVATAQGEPDLPLWNREELTPKLAALVNSDDTPGPGLDDLYNRPLFEKEVLPLVQELKKAVGGSKTLTPDEKLRLSRLVQGEVGGYARSYCAALRRFYLGYRFRSPEAGGLHGELLSHMQPGSRFMVHLRTLADNVVLAGLEEPYLRELQQCLAELQPIGALIYPKGKPAADKRPAASEFPEGLKPYKTAVTQLMSLLDGTSASGSAAGSSDKPSPLAERLGPLGKSALSAVEGRDETPLRMVEKFLDDSGIGGDLRQPFLSPFQAAYRQGKSEIEKTLAQHWRQELLPQVAPLLSRFPFDRAAEREVAPAELDVLNENRGAFFADLKTFYAAVLTERSGIYQQKQNGALGIELPKDLLPTVNVLARLSRALFSADGGRQPLRLHIRGLPGRLVQEERATQNTTAFLQVGKAAAYGFNQQATAIPLSIDWWEQGVAVVGIESTTSRTGRRQTQSIEVADSAWSLFRLLQKSTLERDGVSTWRLNGDGPVEAQALRFVIQPDPWALFQVQLP